MEMRAVLEALRTFDGAYPTLLIRTDSRFVIDGCTKWMGAWKQKGWRKKDGQVVKNQDLWVELSELLERNVVHFAWVKGHSGDEMNTYVDELASEATGVPEAERLEYERSYQRGGRPSFARNRRETQGEKTWKHTR